LTGRIQRLFLCSISLTRAVYFCVLSHVTARRYVFFGAVVPALILAFSATP